MIDDDTDVDPTDLLMGRLVRQELELEQYDKSLKTLNGLYIDACTTLYQIIDALPEPEVLRELCYLASDTDDVYNNYINDAANYIESLKMSLAEGDIIAEQILNKRIENDNKI